jgi:arabinose-5-phosphate isomerase
VIGDALAVCLLELRGFTKDDFAKYHPGGALGKKLFLKVSDILVHNEIPNVNPDASIKKVIIEISEKRKGVTAVTSDTKIVGIITDGDLRRMLSETEDLSLLKAEDIMSKNPISITINAMAIDAMELMDTHRISQLLVEDQGNYAGVIHIHDLIKEGII